MGKLLSVLCNLFASVNVAGCAFLFFDEPKMPKSLIK